MLRVPDSEQSKSAVLHSLSVHQPWAAYRSGREFGTADLSINTRRQGRSFFLRRPFGPNFRIAEDSIAILPSPKSTCTTGHSKGKNVFDSIPKITRLPSRAFDTVGDRPISYILC
jgi:hypothetical protein